MIVGTAGHIDHGKTSLVKALTGIDTDRLKEEKARGITIDLGFAYLPLADGKVLGFVDVPGHERLVHTMIAGAGSIDFALLVIAADDGVMPQTEEHLQVLDLLGVDRGLVALTKIDIVDRHRPAVVVDALQRVLATSALSGADIVPVSSRTGDGIDPLRERLVAEALTQPAPHARGAFRLAVDRSFTIAGAGTVVTGFVVAGAVNVGDMVQVLPSGDLARVRSLHVENRPATYGVQGQRCALNITGPGIEKDRVARGHWLADPQRSDMSARFDATLRIPAAARFPAADNRHTLQPGQVVHVHHGAADLTGRIIPLEPTALQAEGTGLVQVITDQPRPFRRGDRFVIRDAAAQRTIAGGIVLEPRVPPRGRRTPDRLDLLRAMRHDDTYNRLAMLLARPPFIFDTKQIGQSWGLTDEELDAALSRAGATRLGAAYVCSPNGMERLADAVLEALATFHARHPEAPGMSQAALRRTMPATMPPDALKAVLLEIASSHAIRVDGGTAALSSHTAELAPDAARLWRELAPLIAAVPFKPPRVQEIARAVGSPEPPVRRVCKAMARAGVLVELAPDHFFTRDAAVLMAEAACALSGETRGAFTAAQFRDRLGNGRSLAIQILEYFDRRGFTLRRGNERRVIKETAALFGPAGGTEK